jgi:hypothetical protein
MFSKLLPNNIDHEIEKNFEETTEPIEGARISVVG